MVSRTSCFNYPGLSLILSNAKKIEKNVIKDSRAHFCYNTFNYKLNTYICLSNENWSDVYNYLPPPPGEKVCICKNILQSSQRERDLMFCKYKNNPNLTFKSKTCQRAFSPAVIWNQKGANSPQPTLCIMCVGFSRASMLNKLGKKRNFGIIRSKFCDDQILYS